MRRWLASRLLRGPDAEFIHHDLDEMYVRDRARGLSALRCELRFIRRLIHSAISVWRHEAPILHIDHNRSAVTRWRETMLDDLKFALRLCRKQAVPVGFATAGLALAIAVAVSVFTIVDNTMLKPFGIDDPSSVYSASTGNHGFSEFRYSTFSRLRNEAKAIRLEASISPVVRIGLAPGAADPSARTAFFVSGGYMQMLGGRPAVGRPLGPADDAPGAPVVGVLSHAFWQATYNGDPSIVGRPVWINGTAVTVVGVLESEFTGPTTLRPPVWLSLASIDEILGVEPLGQSTEGRVQVVGRVPRGAEVSAAEAELSVIATRVVESRAPAGSRVDKVAVQLLSAASPISGRDAAESYLGIASVFALIALVLAVACANTANLLSAAATTRAHEMGVRLSLGADTRRLVRQMLNESLLLALVAGGLAIALSVWLGPAIASLLKLSDVNVLPDLRTTAFTIAVALVCGLAAGMSPARYGARGDVLGALRNQGHAGGAGVKSRFRNSFIGLQAAVSMLLLVVAALFARTAVLASRADTGFNPDRLVTVSLGGSRTGFDEAAYVQTAASTLRALPSVERVSVTEHLPWGWSLHRVGFQHGGRSYQINVNKSDAEFFPATGVRVVRGRSFTTLEGETQADVALISESVARAFYEGQDPIGQPLSRVPVQEPTLRSATVIGVIADAMLTPMDGEVYGTVLMPIRRLSSDKSKAVNPPGFVVRVSNMGPAVREIDRALRGVDSRMQIEISSVGERLDAYLGWKRMFAWLAVPAALFVLLLSALGMFGVTAFVVSQRMSEMSIRLAMGASGRDVRNLLARESLRPILVGLVIGLAGALLLSQYTGSLFDLSGISSHDPLSVGVALLALGASALAAVLIPAGRAARANPATLFRQQ